MITNIFFLIALIVSEGLTASTAKQAILLNQDFDVALSGSDILKTVPVDFAVQYRAWLHALIVQKGALCKSQRKELQQFCRSVQRSSLPLATQRELVVPLKQLVKHTRRNWIIGLSLVGGVLAGAGILWALKKSQFKSTDFVSTPGLINDDDIMNGSALGSGMPAKTVEHDTLVALGGELPNTPPRAQLNCSGPCGGSPGMILVATGNAERFTSGDLSQWKKTLQYREADKEPDVFLQMGYALLIAGFNQNILSDDLYAVILELCINDTCDEIKNNWDANASMRDKVNALVDQHANSVCGKLLVEYITLVSVRP